MGKCDVIVLAAGEGTRARVEEPKQFVRISGKPMFVHTLETIFASSEINNVILVINPEFKGRYEEIRTKYNFPEITMVDGGSTRQESVMHGLKTVTTERVFIHEAARPYIVEHQLSSLVKQWDELSSCVVPVIKIPFTVSKGGDYMDGEVSRDLLRNIQLPQLFDTEVLRDCHSKSADDGYSATEDSMMLFHYGHKVKFIAGTESNIKITTPYDLHIADLVLHHKSRLIQEYH